MLVGVTETLYTRVSVYTYITIVLCCDLITLMPEHFVIHQWLHYNMLLLYVDILVTYILVNGTTPVPDIYILNTVHNYPQVKVNSQRRRKMDVKFLTHSPNECIIIFHHPH